VPTHVFEGPPDGLGRVDKKLAGVGRSVLSEKPDSPAIELSGRGQRRNEGRKVRPIFRGVGKRMGSGKILDTGSAEASWRVVDANGAFEAKLRGPFCETDDRDMIAKSIPRPGKLTRLRRDFELGFKHLLVVVVARMQHHPVLAECDRLPVVIRRDVPDGEDRHSQMLVPKQAFLAPRSVSYLYHRVVDSTRWAPMDKRPDRLLAADDPEPATVRNENGGAPFVIAADHAGNSLPGVARPWHVSMLYNRDPRFAHLSGRC
jgi:hypothetical protein